MKTLLIFIMSLLVFTSTALAQYRTTHSNYDHCGIYSVPRHVIAASVYTPPQVVYTPRYIYSPYVSNYSVVYVQLVQVATLVRTYTYSNCCLISTRCRCKSNRSCSPCVRPGSNFRFGFSYSR